MLIWNNLTESLDKHMFRDYNILNRTYVLEKRLYDNEKYK